MSILKMGLVRFQLADRGQAPKWSPASSAGESRGETIRPCDESAVGALGPSGPVRKRGTFGVTDDGGNAHMERESNRDDPKTPKAGQEWVLTDEAIAHPSFRNKDAPALVQGHDSSGRVRVRRDGMNFAYEPEEFRRWYRLPFSQPEKGEPKPFPDAPGRWADREGDVWVARVIDGRVKRCREERLSGQHQPWISGPSNWGPFTLISTGEAEKPAAPTRMRGCYECKRQYPLEQVTDVGGKYWGPCHSPFKPDEESERCGPYSGDDLGHEQYIAQQMAAHDSEFHEKEKARILANYEAQRKEPAYQPHWQRTGAVSTYSRRVPR